MVEHRERRNFFNVLFSFGFQGAVRYRSAINSVSGSSTAGFLIWNKAPARIYMGDAGALFLGVLIASLTLRFDPKPIDRFAVLRFQSF